MGPISFMTANYIARQTGYNMHGWGEGDRVTNAHFRPIEMYATRLDEILRDIRALGFDAIDLWQGHLNYEWATTEHINIARDLLRQHNLQVVSLGGWFGSTAQQFETVCNIANELDCGLLSGRTSMLDKDRAFVVRTLQEYDLKLSIENHPEKTPQDLLAAIGDTGLGTIGACVDTGWFGTQGYDAAQAIQELCYHLMHVHLKDVLHAGEPHVTCRYGRGIVPIRACVEILERVDYNGGISIEDEPEQYDPTPDVQAELEMVRAWMSG